MKVRAWVVAVALVFGVGVAAPTSADTQGALTPVDMSWANQVSIPVVDSSILTINDASFRSSLVPGASGLYAVMSNPLPTDPQNVDGYFCSGYTDPRCVGKSIHASIHLPVCLTDESTECIEALRATTDAESLPARFVRGLDMSGPLPEPAGKTPIGPTIVEVHPVADIAADPTRDLPAGTTVGLWEVPGLIDQSRSSFLAVDVGMSFEVTPAGLVQVYGFHAGITAVVERNAQRTYAPHFTSNLDPNGHVGVGGSGYEQECAYGETRSCFVRAYFPDGIELELTMRVSNRVTGWLHGRVIDPVISIEAIDGSSKRLTISGEPSQVPAVMKTVANSQLPPGRGVDRPVWYEGEGVWAGGTTLSAESQFFFDWFRDILPFMGDSSDAMLPTWGVRSVAAFGLHPCLSSNDELVGLVTTNAMMYNGGPPEFRGGRLNYTVGGLHRQPNGELTRGYYSLVMRADAARCLYGFSKAPITAEITVTGESGDEQVATTSMSERKGWLNLRAENFTFSTPTIQAVLTQKKASQPTSLVCIKKRNAKVKGPKRVVLKGDGYTSLKCPKGYRPKAKRPR